MTDELDTLRPEVREALNRISRNFHISADTDTIRTELLRLAGSQAELAALKARIAEAKRVRLGTYPAHGSGYVQIIAEPREGDKTYRLLVDEPPAERGDR